MQNAECRTGRRFTQHTALDAKVWSSDLAMPGDVEPWMTELAQMLILKDLPTGVIVGSAVIDRVEETGEDDKVTRRQGE